MPKGKKKIKINTKPPVVLKVKDPEIPNRKELHPNLMSLPSLTLIIASTKSGKSNYILNLLANSDFIGPDEKTDKAYFEQIKVISTTLNCDPKGAIYEELFDCEDHYSDAMIKNLISSQKSYGSRDDMPFTCLVLDDVLTPDFKKGNEVSMLGTRFRHFNIGLYILSTQSCRAVSPILRSNATDIVIFKQNNKKEYEKIKEEWSPLFGNEETFDKIYNYAIDYKPYSFLYLKLSENPAQAFRCHEERIAEGSKMLFNNNNKNSDENNIE